MEGWLSFLVFAILFYVMMRFGCGAHMAHGHHSGKKENDSGSNYDPVCGMKVEDEKGYGRMFEGQLYRFCSKKCLNEFDEQPEKYTVVLTESKNNKQEHPHGS